MIKKYVKKPIVIEAVQFNGYNFGEVYDWVYNTNIYLDRKYSKECYKENFLVKTLEGDMNASIGDFIIKGVNGEFYPCKPDIFEKTYQEVSSIEEIEK